MLEKLYEILEKVIESKGLKLYDIELLKENDEMLLRISLYKKGGVNLQDCENITNLISPLLDVECQELENYTLEVSSPGLERVLKKERHFLLSKNDLIQIKMNDKSTIKGILKDFKDNILSVEVKDSKDSKTLQIPLSECKKVKTFFEFNS
ncbi:ribosome maturation factor RimP [Helicobacter saguini]|uniref:Ribosome maturation factor RimP n=1 Tax=Helicobacter saguini TaxID=1548018 RepID=A0A347VS70_9HELI|nr:ribosome maturation factor RimP [Helicobacter saguini]MWV62629.1 ribosome maturation factor RimP [Helicobacter saguini]MWV66699.1 ribosome maturation factor RimP [Helicobacter saguini]MWV69049.1 ribosome maturation factor RimP [Helicobacter saguini]MWV71397.1 ribosome maturation factor RimP [Helicobacter saguini]TLD94027.1 ribosome maturation factor RimP [Helicobacter saguini]